MAEVTITENLWHDLLRVARRHRRKPQAVAEEALRDFLRREADEQLLAQSQSAARRSRFA